jgi:hypothetical protein
VAPAPGNDADHDADQRAAQEGHLELDHFGQRREFGIDAAVGVGRRAVAGEALFHAGEDLAQAVGADHHQQVLDAVLEEGHAEGEALGAVDRIDADGGDQQAQHQADGGVGDRAAAERHHAGEAEDDDGEILRRGEGQGELGDRRRGQHHDHGRQQAAAQRGEQRPAQRLGRLALARHGVAVPQQGHVDRLARDAEQDGGEGAAVGAGDIHRRQQDDRRQQFHAVGEGQRQHHAHHQRQARQHGDQHAQHQADEQHQQVHRLQHLQEAVAEVDKRFHQCTPMVASSQSETAEKGSLPSGSET